MGKFWKILNFWLSVSKRKNLKHNGLIPDLMEAILPAILPLHDNDTK